MSSYFDTINFKSYAKPVTDLDLANRDIFARSKKQGKTLNTAYDNLKNVLHGKKENNKSIEQLNKLVAGVKKGALPIVFELDIELPTEPLTLLMNPNQFSLRYAVKMSENRVRWIDARDSGYVIQVHHDELVTISVSGVSGMFYTESGLTSDDRESSIAWENINQLLATYRNNGINYNNKITVNNAAMINSVGRVIITYDGTIYRGNFNSFNFNESDTQPFFYDYSFEYKVTDMSEPGNTIYNYQNFTNSI